MTDFSDFSQRSRDTERFFGALTTPLDPLTQDFHSMRWRERERETHTHTHITEL